MSYRDRFYQRYVSTHFGAIREISIQACENHRNTFRSYFKEHLPRSTQAKILDIGCGYGAFLYFLDKEGFQDVHGVEISPEQVEAAKQMGIPNVSAGDLLEYLLAHPENFDCITALDVIEHFPKDEILSLLDAVFQALKPAGKLIVQVPNGGSPFAGLIRYGDFTHELAFTKTSIQQVLMCSGFSKVEVFPTEPIVHGLASAVRWGAWKIIHLILQGYQAVEKGTYRGDIFTQNVIALGIKRVK